MHVAAASTPHICWFICLFAMILTSSVPVVLQSSKFASVPWHMRLLSRTGTTDWLTGMMGRNKKLKSIRIKFKLLGPVQREKEQYYHTVAIRSPNSMHAEVDIGISHPVLQSSQIPVVCRPHQPLLYPSFYHHRLSPMCLPHTLPLAQCCLLACMSA